MKADVLVIGGGIVGLASALKILERKPLAKIVLLEKEAKLAAHQTGNNSGVIHSGVYYKPGSAKAKNCFLGYQKMLDFCENHGIHYDLCGKVIIASSDSELPALQKIYDRGSANGLTNLKLIDASQLKEIEPHSVGVKAIHVPQAGIVNYTKVALAMAQKIQASGGTIELSKKVVDISKKGSYRIVRTKDGSEYSTKSVVNCAGLYSDRIAVMSGANIDHKIVPFRGEYYELKEDVEHLVKGLIYPVPNPEFPFLGVHFTRMADGGVEAGPNAVLAFRREGYRKRSINLSELIETLTFRGFQKVAGKYWKDGSWEMYRSFSKGAFTRALQKLIPEIKRSDLKPGGAGVRAQACGTDGKLHDDFLILKEPNVINVCNAPSPAATSSLAIGESIAMEVLKHVSI